MGISDKLKDLTQMAQDAVVEHEDQILQGIEKVELAVDQQTGGRYHDQIAKAGAKTKGYVEGLKPAPAAAEPPVEPAA